MADVYAAIGSGFGLEEMCFGHGIPELGLGNGGVKEQPGATVDREPGQPAQQGSPGSLKAPGNGPADEDAVSRIAGDLANGLSRVLMDAVQHLQMRNSAELSAWVDSIRRQQEKLSSAAEELKELEQRSARLQEAASEQESLNLAAQQRHEALSARTASLEEAWAGHRSEVEILHQETQGLSVSLAARLDALCSRVQVQEEEFLTLKPAVSETSFRVTALVEKLDRQAEVIRLICDAEAQRAAALDQLVEVLARFKASWVPVFAVAESQLSSPSGNR